MTIVNIRLYKCIYILLLLSHTQPSGNPGVTPESPLDGVRQDRISKQEYLILLDSSTKIMSDSVRISVFSTLSTNPDKIWSQVQSKVI